MVTVEINCRRLLGFCHTRNYHLFSHVFRPQSGSSNAIIPTSESVSFSQKLLDELGIIRSRGNGMFALLPVGMKVVKKLENIIEREMGSIGGQKIHLPTLCDASLWMTSGRFETMKNELAVFRDRHGKDYVLAPTHEEAVTKLVAEIRPFSYRNLPLRIYQISTKVRDEQRLRYGLLRAKEFLMKDLYTFDDCEESAVKTYEEVSDAYKRIFNSLHIPWIKASASVGDVGGSLSHEFHYPSSFGEDIILQCNKCAHNINKEIDLSGDLKCMHCGSEMTKTNGIEVAHTFQLGYKYSKAFDASYQDKNGKTQLIYMGCYGIGVTRLLGAMVEAKLDEGNIRWPVPVAPYIVSVVPPKLGSKEEQCSIWTDHIVASLSALIPPDDIIVDDRTTSTIGKRVTDAKKLGIPFIIVLSKRACETVPKFECIDNLSKETSYCTLADVVQCIHNVWKLYT